MVLSKREEDRLKKVFEFLDCNKDGKICLNDLHQTLLSIKYEADKKELEEWIWEVWLHTFEFTQTSFRKASTMPGYLYRTFISKKKIVA
jgi:Ca2+-binding EF-hand superfamily protein